MSHQVRIARSETLHAKGPMLVERALRALFSLGEEQVVASPIKQLEEIRKSAAVLSFDCSVESTNALAHAGFRKIRPFVILPSINEPRWLLPEDNARQAVGGLKLYTPFSVRTRVLKALGMGIAATGFPGRSKSRVLVASREPLPIENFIRGLTRELHPGFAVSIGTPGTCQKLTAQAMSPAGEILAYIKIPLGPGAHARIRNEAHILEKLSKFPRMRSRIPRLLNSSGNVGDRILVQTRLAGDPGPIAFTSFHQEFLQDLQACDPVWQSGESIVENTSRVWESAAEKLDPSWQDLAAEALHIASRELSGKRLRCAPMHGDFTPWNSRSRTSELSCFDWESANWSAPIHWDKFHFLAQTHSLINEGAGPEVLPETRNGARISFILYLLYSTAQLAAENSAPKTLEYREALLRRQLSGERTGVPLTMSQMMAGSGLDITSKWDDRIDD